MSGNHLLIGWHEPTTSAVNRFIRAQTADCRLPCQTRGASKDRSAMTSSTACAQAGPSSTTGRDLRPLSLPRRAPVAIAVAELPSELLTAACSLVLMDNAAKRRIIGRRCKAGRSPLALIQPPSRTGSTRRSASAADAGERVERDPVHRGARFTHPSLKISSMRTTCAG